MQPHYSQSNCENVTPSSGTSPLAYYAEVPPGCHMIFLYFLLWVSPLMFIKRAN